MTQPKLVLHMLPPSPPCMTAEAALAYKGLEYERVALVSGRHGEVLEPIYGEGRTTVPGLLVDGDPVHGSRAILEALEQIAPEPTLYPEAIAADVREADRWGDSEFQDLGRRLPWGALHFRPEAMGTFAGAGALDGPGTDYAMRYIHASWKYHKITAARLHDDLAGLPDKLSHIEALARDGVIGADTPPAADLQIGATLRVLLVCADLRPLIEGGAGEAIARRWFPDYPGEIPAGAYPAGWVPSFPSGL
jgi:glutathione S-transferase